MTNQDFCGLGLAVVETELAAIKGLRNRIDSSFGAACETMLKCKGRVVVMGMGKSGHIGHKIAATLASTGTPAFFVHPGEASHGDLGMLTRNDVVLALSNSGNTTEILTLLPVIARLHVPLIAMTGSPDSELAKAATVHLDVSIEKEACPLGLAPTASTTACLVMGDALAIALLNARGFTEADFALSHPGGNLGRRLLLRIDDVMHKGEAIPSVTPDTLLSQALIEITNKRLGMTTVLDDAGLVLGIFTDGDLRRTLDQNIDLHKTPVKQVMTTGCQHILPHALAAEALHLMETHKITALLVTDDSTKLLGVVHMHDLLRAGVV